MVSFYYTICDPVSHSLLLLYFIHFNTNLLLHFVFFYLFSLPRAPSDMIYSPINEKSTVRLVNKTVFENKATDSCLQTATICGKI